MMKQNVGSADRAVRIVLGLAIVSLAFWGPKSPRAFLGLLLKDKGQMPPAACKLDAAAHLYQQLGMERGFRDAILALDHLKRNANA